MGNYWSHSHPPFLLVGTGKEKKNLDEAFVKVVACNRLDSVTQEDMRMSMFIKTVLSVTRVQAPHVNNPAFLSWWRQEHGFCPAASKERVAFLSNELMDRLCQ